MSSDLMLDVGQANELKLAFRRARFSNNDIKRLCEGDVLTEVRSVLRGHALVTVIEHVIDCDADPLMEKHRYWTVEEHQKGGQWKWDPKQVSMYFPKTRKPGKNGEYLDGNALREELKGKPVLNANVLDYLLANQRLIPEEWKAKSVFFWGTVYRNSSMSDLCVRCLWWYGCHWTESLSHFKDYHGCDHPIAMRTD